MVLFIRILTFEMHDVKTFEWLAKNKVLKYMCCLSRLMSIIRLEMQSYLYFFLYIHRQWQYFLSIAVYIPASSIRYGRMIHHPKTLDIYSRLFKMGY